jgi:CDGSH-type Zn-finger protein
MQVRKTEDGKVYALCGCGRSPTGNCCGWHSLTEEQYKVKKDEYDLAKYRESAEELWFSGGSCTGGRSE